MLSRQNHECYLRLINITGTSVVREAEQEAQIEA